MKITNYYPFLKNPRLWPHLARITRRKIARLIYEDVDHNELIKIQKLHAENYLNDVSITSNEALKKLKVNYDIDMFLKNISPHLKLQTTSEKCPYNLGGEGNLPILYAICESIKASQVIETGVAYGWSSLSILLSISKREGSKLFSVTCLM